MKYDTYYGILDVLKYNRNHWLSVGRYRVIEELKVFYKNLKYV